MTDQIPPDEARALLDGTTPGPWRVDPRHAGEVLSPENHWLAGAYETEDQFTPDELARAQSDTRLIAAAPTLAAMIAGMTTEYRHEVQSIADGTWHPLTEWAEGEPDLRPWNVTPTRIVRRYVTTPEEA